MNVDGILIDTAASTTSDQPFALIRQREVPLVFFDRKLKDHTTPGVYFEDYRLSFQLTTELIDRGFTKMMYMAGPPQISINYERRRGFREAMDARNVPVHEPWIIATGMQEEDGYRSFRDFINTVTPLPQAVMCVTDSVALGVYRACAEAAIIIPDQLSVVGFGNLLVSALVQPPLATVALPVEQASIQAVKNLIDLIEKKETPTGDEFFSGQILLRKSVRDKA